jgi:hypothetical protein
MSSKGMAQELKKGHKTGLRRHFESAGNFTIKISIGEK